MSSYESWSIYGDKVSTFSIICTSKKGKDFSFSVFFSYVVYPEIMQYVRGWEFSGKHQKSMQRRFCSFQLLLELRRTMLSLCCCLFFLTTRKICQNAVTSKHVFNNPHSKVFEHVFHLSTCIIQHIEKVRKGLENKTLWFVVLMITIQAIERNLTPNRLRNMHTIILNNMSQEFCKS